MEGLRLQLQWTLAQRLDDSAVRTYSNIFAIPSLPCSRRAGETTVYPLRSWSCKQWSVWLYIMLEAECKRRERRQQFSTSDAGNNVT